MKREREREREMNTMTFINPVCIINDDSKAFGDEGANGKVPHGSKQPQQQEELQSSYSLPPAPPSTINKKQQQYSSPSSTRPSFKKVGGGGSQKQHKQQQQPPPPPPPPPPPSSSSHHHHTPRQQEQHQWRPSMTAPCFTPHEEQEERDSLSKDEAEYIQKEILGDNDTFIVDYESNNDVNVCVTQLNQFIEDSISMSDKKEYLHAQQVCPQLVQTETNPIMFLRSENYNIKVCASTIRREVK